MNYDKTVISRLIFCVFFSLFILPVVSFGQTEMSLEEVVRGYLWSENRSDFEKAESALKGNKAFGEVDRGRFHDLEEILRRGRTEFPAVGETIDGNFPVVEIEVALPGGEQIPVFVQLPPDYSTEISWPLMFAMHGGPPGSAEGARSSARRMINVWESSAGKFGWIVASPSMATTVSQGRRTQDRLPYEIFHEEEIRAVYEALRARYRINTDRLVSTGISLGSNFSIALGCAHPDWLSGIVPVSTEGDSRELLLRNLALVPTYVLEGSQDRNIWGIGGPQGLRDIVAGFGYDLTYREFSDRAHEGFQDHYDDVLSWLDSRARQVYPSQVIRVPHPAIMPIARRVGWIESDTRQGLVRGDVNGPNRIDITARWARTLKVYLHDRLVNLDKPIEIWVNGEKVFSEKVDRSIRTALEQVRILGDERRIYAAEVTVKVPLGSTALKEAEKLSAEMEPQYPEQELSFWERYAVGALEDRFEELGFEGVEVKLPDGVVGGPEQSAIKITSVVEGSAWRQAGLQTGDILLEVDSEPFFSGTDNLGVLYQWLIRELRTMSKIYPVYVLRDEKRITLEVPLKLGPYTFQ